METLKAVFFGPDPQTQASADFVQPQCLALLTVIAVSR